MGSSTAGCAARIPSRTAAAAAMRKAMSEESTAWAVPSVITCVFVGDVTWGWHFEFVGWVGGWVGGGLCVGMDVHT